MPDALEYSIRLAGYKVDECKKFNLEDTAWTLCVGVNAAGDVVTLSHTVFASARQAEACIAGWGADDAARVERVFLRDRSAVLDASAELVAPTKELMAVVFPEGKGIWEVDGAVAAERIRAHGWQIYEHAPPEVIPGARRHRLYFKRGQQAGELRFRISLKPDKSRIEDERALDNGFYHVHQYNGSADALIYDRAVAEAVALRRKPPRDE
jgi:hypothetical protein